MDQLLAGVCPETRNDGTSFEDSKLVGDKWRAKQAGESLGFKGGIVEKRGDWAWLKEALRIHGSLDYARFQTIIQT